MDEAPAEPVRTRNWRLVIGVTPILIGLFLYRLWFPGAPAAVPETLDARAEAAFVTLRIERPEAEPREASVPWSEGQTVAQATQQANLSAVWRGEGEMAFLESLAGVANQGADGLNWQFEVNGDYADRGAGAVVLEPGDRVLWKLAPYE